MLVNRFCIVVAAHCPEYASLSQQGACSCAYIVGCAQAPIKRERLGQISRREFKLFGIVERRLAFVRRGGKRHWIKEQRLRGRQSVFGDLEQDSVRGRGSVAQPVARFL